MTNTSHPDLAKLLPHTSPMILIDELLSQEDKSISVRVDMNKTSLFSEADGRVPSYVGIEYMAQAIATLVGIKRLQENLPIKLGFLLGSRKYQCSQDYFEAGQDLIIEAKEYLRDNELAVFDCKIFGSKLIASAQIKAILPKNLDLILQENN